MVGNSREVSQSVGLVGSLVEPLCYSVGLVEAFGLSILGIGSQLTMSTGSRLLPTLSMSYIMLALGM